jgi:Ca2+-binding EF-hand superfamily protein
MGRGDPMHRFDTDRDGQVTRAELEAAQKKQLELFERADADHDGRLTREEMRALRAQRWTERRDAPRGERPALARPPVEPSKD